MRIEEYLAGITELYQGEIIGEGLFSTLLATCPQEHAYGMALLLQLESEAKVRLRPAPFWRLGIVGRGGSSPCALLAFKLLTQAEANARGGRQWSELAELVKPYLARYQALEAAGRPDSDKAGTIRFMVTSMR